MPRSAGSGKRSTVSVTGSTRTIAFSPLSVIQGAPSGPTITPCGAEPEPNGMWCVSPVVGSNRPSSPRNCAVYHTVPSGAGATSCGCDPAGTAYSMSASVPASDGDTTGGVVAGEMGAATGITPVQPATRNAANIVKAIRSMDCPIPSLPTEGRNCPSSRVAAPLSIHRDREPLTWQPRESCGRLDRPEPRSSRCFDRRRPWAGPK